MSDVPEGGGGMTGNVIVDGQSNNIFEDISTLDRVYGAVHMRKVFPSVNTQTQDKYFGSHVIISKLPGDGKIGVNLFNTGDWFDRRPEAQSRVENYRAKGATYSGFLWATQWKDSRIISIFQSETAPVPGIGDVLYLTNKAATTTQFIKITKLEESVQTFTDNSGTFSRRILSIEISQTLNYDFVGSEISRFDTLSPDASVKTTVVANAAKYYSARPLAVQANDTDLSVKVDTVYSQVIPSSQQELAILDADASGASAQLIDAGNGNVAFSISTSFVPGFNLYMGNPCLPGTLSITVPGGTLTDSGGQVKSGAISVGTINYAAGTISFGATSPTYSGSKTVTFRPAAAPVKIADTSMLAVTAANRGFVWVTNINPPPEPGSVEISFMALGEWYSLYDNASGGLSGQEAGIGTGTINYVTGSISLSLSAMPDADSAIMLSWGMRSNYFNRSNFAVESPKYKYTLANQGIARGTLTIAWNDGIARLATADNSGNLTGDATGKVNHAKGTVEFTPTTMPLGGSSFTIDYQYGTPFEQTFPYPARDGSGNLAIDLLTADVLPNSVEIEWNTFTDFTALTTSEELIPDPRDPIELRVDDGAGGFVNASNEVLTKTGGTGLATIDYVNSIITWQPDVTISIPKPVYNKVLVGTKPVDGTGMGGGIATTPAQVLGTFKYVLSSISYVEAPSLYPNDTSGYVKIRYRTTDSPAAVQEVFTANSVEIDLTNQFAEDIVPGSVSFEFSGKRYYDVLGQVFFDINRLNGSGIYAGSIDYTTGNITITNWNQGGTTAVALKSLVTSIATQPVDEVTFRIPGSPIKVQSFQFRVSPLDGGGQLNGVSDATGHITGTDILGFIVYATGVVTIRFGIWVTAAGNEAEDWYNVDEITAAGEIFKPRLVHADTMLYNAVSQTFLPLDSAILGLDPVRLPQDGRIPVYAPGDVVVILHDQATTGTYVNATQTDLGRGRISKLTVRDSADQEILATRYTADLDTGLIDWVDLSGVAQPLTITDRIEDMAILTDVQITGTLSLSQPLTHVFPVGETLVSNAVIYGDLFAHTSIPFDQQTWTGVWSNTLIGSQVSAQYNNSGFPIEVDNASAIQERWQVIFTGATTVNIIGESVGQILTGVSIGTGIAPINPNTGQAYFTIPISGWGAGWSSGNVLRFNTIAANAPTWIIQSIAQGEATDTDYTFCLEVRGDIDTP